MQYYLIFCKSLTYAQKATRILERSGISAGVAKLPRGLSDDGCGYAVRVSAHRLSDALRSMKNAGIEPKRIFGKNSDGTISEVRE